MVHKLTKFSAIFSPEILPQLLDFVNDSFIIELLPNLTRYTYFASTADQHLKHAVQKAGEIITQLKVFA